MTTERDKGAVLRHVPGLGTWVKIRALSPDERRAAELHRFCTTMEAVADLDIEGVLAEATPEQVEAAVALVKADRVALVDVQDVIRAGVLAWGLEAPIDDDRLRSLDPRTADYLADRILCCGQEGTVTRGR